MAKDVQDVFRAVADPTRREIIEILVLAGTALSIRDIAANFPATRQAVTKHINILHEAGLLALDKQGRESLYSANPAPLREIHEWSAHYRRFWNRKLDNLEAFLDAKATKKKGKRKK